MLYLCFHPVYYEYRLLFHESMILKGNYNTDLFIFEIQFLTMDFRVHRAKVGITKRLENKCYLSRIPFCFVIYVQIFYEF